ncbi:unnamed protein product [Meganyctiphanes norvegica]|uniref:Heparan sulfate glucosamine 3-O-sulfotransferase 5 n=1 Tax=Meganyctiphanes norvegica TaxID=48144 RepID=A0AAV2RSE1_MEGNR
MVMGAWSGGSYSCSNINISASIRRPLTLVLLAFLVICVVIYYSAPGATTLYDAYRKRLRFRGTQRRLPQSLIIGVRKCGTRALLEMLNLHPHVQKNGVEMHFFDDDERFANGFEWYRKKMPYSFDDQVTVEKTPSYFISREAPARIHSMNSSMKLLLIVREPAMRVLSDYTQIKDSKERKGITVPPFEQKVITPEGEVNDSYKAVKISQYAVHIIPWLRVFKREQILIIDGDVLIKDPFTEIEKVQKFLNLPPYITEDNFYYNDTKGFYCMRNETFQKCLADSKGRPHPHVDPNVMSRLRRFFAPFNEQFYNMVGHNFSWPTS